MSTSPNVKPFLKWVGGKGALLPRLAPLLPRPEGLAGYREPFLGGGAVFFALYSAVRPAHLSDANPDLIAAYVAVRDHLDELAERLGAEQQHADLEVRFHAHRNRLNAHRSGAAPLSVVERAVSVFVLNRWGFNGLWRERADGQITTPFGHPAEGRALFDDERLRACSAALHGVHLAVADFADAVRDAGPGELVYLDPPYAPAAGAAGDSYTGYTGGGFSYRPRQLPLLPDAVARTDQDRLESTLEQLDAAGVLWVLSNQPSLALGDLRRRWVSRELSARRSVSADPATRGEAAELLLSNWPGIAAVVPGGGTTAKGRKLRTGARGPYRAPVADGEQP